MAKGMVLDIETRIDAAAVRSSRRRTRPSGMPTGLQTIAAAAMLEFEVDGHGLCSGFTLNAVERAGIGEPALVTSVERRLGTLADADGTLVTFNGAHDLGILRLAAARLHRFERAASAHWIRDRADRHDDVMLEFSAGGRQTWPRLDDLAASFGILSGREMVMLTDAPTAARMKCELDVVVTMMLYLHILSERHRSMAPLLHGVTGLAEVMEDRMRTAPHFQAALRAELFTAACRR